MLYLNLSRLIRMRSKQQPMVYLIVHGFTRDEARSLMNPLLRSVKFTMLTRLCKLFVVYPSDLFGNSGDKDDPLNGLNIVDGPVVDDFLDGLSPKDIAEIRRIAEEKRKK